MLRFGVFDFGSKIKKIMKKFWKSKNDSQKIDELIEANTKIGRLFRSDLKGIDDDLDILLSSISVDILKYIQNIDTYIKQISLFIIQTKNRRLQNKKINKLDCYIC